MPKVSKPLLRDVGYLVLVVKIRLSFFQLPPLLEAPI